MAKGRLSSGSSTGSSSSKVLLFILTLLMGNSCFFTSAADSDSVMSLVAGIDKASEALVDHNDRCSSGPPLSQKVEENVAWLEGLLERQWDMIEGVRGKVDNATRRTQELVDHYYTVSPTEAPDACVAPFRRVAGGCFWIHKNPGQTWEVARARCQQEGADLATPQDIQAVMNFLQGEFGRGYTYFWLGGKKTSVGEWKWLQTDVRIDTGYGLWHDSRREGSCTVVNGAWGYKLNQWDCNDTNWYLCEKKIES